jgi:hypothetical protein
LNVSEAFVLEKLYKRSSFTASDLPSFRRQETVFILLTVGLLAVLLLAQSTFSYWGRPSRGLLLLLIAVFVNKYGIRAIGD